MGLLLFASLPDPVSKIGVTFATFQMSGKTPYLPNKLRIIVRG